MVQRSGGARTVGELLTALLDRLELGSAAKATLAVIRWPEIVGSQIAAHARAERVRRGVLTVSVDSGVWATELSAHLPVLLERLSQAVGEGVVTDVHFVVGRQPRSPGRPGAGPGDGPREAGGVGRPTWPDRRDLLGVGLTDEERERIAALAARTRDPALAEATARWLALTLKAKRWLGQSGVSAEGGPHNGRSSGEDHPAPDEGGSPLPRANGT